MSRLRKRLLARTAQACIEFGMLGEGLRIGVAVSGGKDSFTLMTLLEGIRSRVPWPLELVAINLDQGEPGFDQQVISGWCEERGFAHHLVRRDIASVVRERIPAGKTPCSLCARLRRGILYDAAVDLGCDRLALGHHREDFIETVLLNLLYSGQLKGMAPVRRSDDGRNVVIRPLVYCAEEEIEAFAREQRFPVVTCGTCGAPDQKRRAVKRLIAELHADNDKVKGNMLAALANVRPSHLLDRELWAELGYEP